MEKFLIKLLAFITHVSINLGSLWILIKCLHCDPIWVLASWISLESGTGYLRRVFKEG